MNSKKLLSLILSVLIIFSALSMLAVSSSAAAVKLSADKSKASIGEIVTVSYKVPKGVDMITGAIQVDGEYLNVVEVKATNHAGYLETSNRNPRVGFAGMNLNTSDNEAIVQVKLKVLKMGGTVTAEVKEAYDKNSSPLTIDGATLTIKPGDKNINFPDVKEGSWYYDAVEYCVLKGYVNGYSNGYFGSVDNLKRQDFVVMLARIAHADLSKYSSTKSDFPDVKANSYYIAAVNWASKNNIVAGYNNGNFGVGDNITREQVCTILYRYCGSPAVENAQQKLAKFSDANKISAYAVDPLAWAVENGVISGMADGRAAPGENASRAQIVVIIQRMDEQGMFNNQ